MKQILLATILALSVSGKFAHGAETKYTRGTYELAPSLPSMTLYAKLEFPIYHKLPLSMSIDFREMKQLDSPALERARISAHVDNGIDIFRTPRILGEQGAIMDLGEPKQDWYEDLAIGIKKNEGEKYFMYEQNYWKASFAERVPIVVNHVYLLKFTDSLGSMTVTFRVASYQSNVQMTLDMIEILQDRKFDKK